MEGDPTASARNLPLASRAVPSRLFHFKPSPPPRHGVRRRTRAQLRLAAWDCAAAARLCAQPRVAAAAAPRLPRHARALVHRPLRALPARRRRARRLGLARLLLWIIRLVSANGHAHAHTRSRTRTRQCTRACARAQGHTLRCTRKRTLTDQRTPMGHRPRICLPRAQMRKKTRAQARTNTAQTYKHAHAHTATHTDARARTHARQRTDTQASARARQEAKASQCGVSRGVRTDTQPNSPTHA
eukprot:6182930-Pleurochrysis_carterae.AAC.1